MLKLPAISVKAWNKHTIAVIVQADNLPIRANAKWSSRIKGAGKVNGCETARAQPEAVVNPPGIVVVAHDLSVVVDSSGHCGHSAGKVDSGEVAGPEQKTMGVSRRIGIGTNDLAQVIHPLKNRGGSAGKVKDGEGSMV